MPDNDVALEVLARTGPLAVSSANTSGLPAARTADIAESMLGPSVAVILDGGPTPGPEPSTIVDATGPQGRVLRLGVVPLERLNEIVAPTGVEILDQG
jgi:tRNA A37 threonylcarbamoyladenosine synthetase subunit TsaC/SUA5/YrdC